MALDSVHTTKTQRGSRIQLVNKKSILSMTYRGLGSGGLYRRRSSRLSFSTFRGPMRRRNIISINLLDYFGLTLVMVANL